MEVLDVGIIGTAWIEVIGTGPVERETLHSPELAREATGFALLV